QRQLQRSGARFGVQRIFFSHLHLDHVLGLPGYLGTLGLLGRRDPMRIYGPLGSRQFLQMLAGLAGGIDYSVDLQELDDGTAVEAGVRRLALTHLSPRHQDTPAPLLREASAVFPGSFLPNDLDELEIPLLP